MRSNIWKSSANGGIASPPKSKPASPFPFAFSKKRASTSRGHKPIPPKGSAYQNTHELRCQHEGRPYRVLYAFDPCRVALLLIGGDKTGNNRWYEMFVPKADAIYSAHLQELKKEKK